MREQVDHCRKYNQPGEKNEEGEYVQSDAPSYNALPPTIEGASPTPPRASVIRH